MTRIYSLSERGGGWRAQVEALEREQAECAAAVARKEEELVDLLQERARDRAALADKDMASQEQAGRPPSCAWLTARAFLCLGIPSPQAHVEVQVSLLEQEAWPEAPWGG